MKRGFAASEIDTSRPHPARMYDAYLGGKDNYAPDREADRQVLRAAPEVRDTARANRAFGHPAAIGPDAPVRRRPPRPKGPTKATGPVRDKVLALRARQLPVTQIAQILAREGTRSPRRPSGRSATARACPGSAATTPPAA